MLTWRVPSRRSHTRHHFSLEHKHVCPDGHLGASRCDSFKKLRNARQQRGLSFLEFVGCLFAMCGGVVLGSMYLGIDVQQMAVGVLEQAQVVATGYFDQVAQAPAANETKTVEIESTDGADDSKSASTADSVAEDSTPETAASNAESAASSSKQFPNQPPKSVASPPVPIGTNLPPACWPRPRVELKRWAASRNGSFTIISPAAKSGMS